MSSNEKIELRIKHFLSDILRESLPENNNDISRKKIKKWDSINHLKIILSMENEFKIKFSDTEAFEIRDYNMLLER